MDRKNSIFRVLGSASEKEILEPLVGWVVLWVTLQRK